MQSVKLQTYFLFDISRNVSAKRFPERDGTNLINKELGTVSQVTYTFTNRRREIEGKAKIMHAKAPIIVDLPILSGLKLIK
jgi:hypothetical protein